MNMKMNITDKIDIEGILDNFWYARMAFLVDKNDFIEMVAKARESLGLIIPMSYDEAKKWLSNKPKEESVRLLWKLSVNIQIVKEKFQIGNDYSNAIKFAILTGKITDKELNSELVCETYPFSQEFEEAELFVDEPVVAIFVGPETKIEEVKKIMSGKVKELFKELSINRNPLRRGKNIRDVRKWYWLKKEMTYENLYNFINKDKDPNKFDSHDMIKRAVERYMKKLKCDK